MPSQRVELAQVEADLAEARLRADDLQHSWAVATYTASGTRRPEEIDVELAQVNARILALEERRAALLGAPGGPDTAPAVAALSAEREPPPALPVAPAAPPSAAPAEYLTTREAADLLRVHYKTLEAQRARGEGPPFVRIGHRVRYRRSDLTPK